MDALLTERFCYDICMIDIHTDVGSSGIWFWFSELNGVMFQMTVTRVSHSLCIPVSSFPACPHDAHAFFVSEMSSILRCKCSERVMTTMTIPPADSFLPPGSQLAPLSLPAPDFACTGLPSTLPCWDAPPNA